MSLSDIVNLSLEDVCEMYRRGQFPTHLERLSVHELVTLFYNEASAVQIPNDDELEVFEDALESVDTPGKEEELLVKVNPLSTTTECVEHFHSLSHRKTPVQTVREYIQSWAMIVRECAKSMCSWSFQLFAGHKSSYYFQPESTRIPLSSIPRVPKLESSNNLSDEQNLTMRNLCKEFKALPQASTRAFTSKFKAGTLPLQAYETVEDCASDEDEVAAASDNETVLECENETASNYIDEEPEFDSSSGSEEDFLDSTNDDDDTGRFRNVNQNVITRSGRTVIASKKYMFD